ncbi:MAG: hypothetical protein ACKPE6_01870 [Gammaproteobacteria bacterium]
MPHASGPGGVPAAEVQEIERLVAEAVALCEDLRAVSVLPDLEKCSLAAARASDCLASPPEWTPPRPAMRFATTSAR